MKCITKAKRAVQGRGGTWRARNESSKGEEWRCVGDEERGEEPGEELRAVWGLGSDALSSIPRAALSHGVTLMKPLYLLTQSAHQPLWVLSQPI